MQISWTLLTVKTATTAVSTPARLKPMTASMVLVKKSGELNKAQKYMVLSPGDSMGYDPKRNRFSL